MVLRLQLSKTSLLTASTASFVVPISRVMSSPTSEPIAFSDANRYEAWHSVMRDEIQAQHSNNTWFLVPFHSLMNVVGSRWVYRIKHRMDDNIERYKACLVARGFTWQEDINYSKTFSPVVKPATVKLVFSIIMPSLMVFLLKRST